MSVDMRVFRRQQGKGLAQKRKEAGYTQKELARYIGVSVSYVRAWEYGQREIPPTALHAMTLLVKPRIEQRIQDTMYLTGYAPLFAL